MDKATTDKDAMEKWLKEAEAGWKRVIEEKNAAESTEALFQAEADS